MPIRRWRVEGGFEIDVYLGVTRNEDPVARVGCLPVDRLAALRRRSQLVVIRGCVAAVHGSCARPDRGLDANYSKT